MNHIIMIATYTNNDVRKLADIVSVLFRLAVIAYMPRTDIFSCRRVIVLLRLFTIIQTVHTLSRPIRCIRNIPVQLSNEPVLYPRFSYSTLRHILPSRPLLQKASRNYDSICNSCNLAFLCSPCNITFASCVYVY